jgi:uncharacterized protein (DUF2141 family)
MASNLKCNKYLFFWLCVLANLLISACASIQQPQGGPRDTEPPKILNEVPKNLTKNFSGKKIDITFDEYFKLSNELQEISISPTQEIPPTFRIKQKTLEINFKDSLEKNTTYTINFGKAIQDVNESIVLKNYSYVFSTGNKIDSLQIKGKVINSFDNKVVIDATVFIIPVSRDSIFGKKRASIYTLTDSSGNFSLKNIKENTYRIYALREENGGDKIYNQPSEQIAFIEDPIKLKKDTSGIILKIFKEIPNKFRVLDQKIQSDGKITIVFNKGIKKPSIRFLNENPVNPFIEFSPKADSLSIWLREIKFDSLKLEIRDANKPIDTLKIRRSKTDTYLRTLSYTDNLSGNKIRPNTKFTIRFNQPIKGIDKSKIVLLEDTTEVNGFSINKMDNGRDFQIIYPYRIKKLYTLQLNAKAVEDIYGTNNKLLKTKFQLDEVENYGNLSLKILRTDTTKNYIVQLIDDKGVVYKNDVINTNKTLTYSYLNNTKYRVKVIEDLNKNGEYDTGNLARKEQAEKSWFFEKDIIIRPNWDQEYQVLVPGVFK